MASDQIASWRGGRLALHLRNDDPVG